MITASRPAAVASDLVGLEAAAATSWPIAGGEDGDEVRRPERPRLPPAAIAGAMLSGVILAAVIGADTEPRCRRTGWGRARRYRTTKRRRMGGPGNAQRAHERDDTGGQGRHRRPKDGRQRSGADAGAQPPRPPAPATPQTPTVDRDATDARQAVHRQGSPRSGPGSTRPALEARLYRAMLLQAGAIVGAVVAILRMLD